MKFYGKIGFSITEKTSPGIWTPSITTRNYSGDVIQLTKRLDSGEHINDGLRLNVQISIICDPWFQENLSRTAYVEYLGNKWKIESISPQYPRMILTLGGLYHEEEEEIDEDNSSDSGDSGEDTGV